MWRASRNHKRRHNSPGDRVPHMRSNENKISDGGRGRTSLGVEVWKSSQKWSVRRSAVRFIAWLGVFACSGDLNDPIIRLQGRTQSMATTASLLQQLI